MAISTDDALTRGQTVVDRLKVAPDPRNRQAWAHAPPVVRSIDVPRFKGMLFDAVGG